MSCDSEILYMRFHLGGQTEQLPVISMSSCAAKISLPRVPVVVVVAAASAHPGSATLVLITVPRDVLGNLGL
jgi:hypothetical protein